MVQASRQVAAPPANDRRLSPTISDGGESFTQTLTSAAQSDRATGRADAYSTPRSADDVQSTTESRQDDAAANNDTDRTTSTDREALASSADSARSDAQDAPREANATGEDSQQTDHDDASDDDDAVVRDVMLPMLFAGAQQGDSASAGKPSSDAASAGRTAPAEAAQVAQQPQAVLLNQQRASTRSTATHQPGEVTRADAAGADRPTGPAAVVTSTDADTSTSPRTHLEQRSSSASQPVLPVDADPSTSPAERRAMQLEWQLAAQRAAAASGDASSTASPRGMSAMPLSMTSSSVAVEGTGSSGATTSMSHTAMLDDTRMTGQVMRGMTAVMNQRGGSLTMRLDPPELGQMRIQMTITRGSVSAVFHATTDAAREALERNMTTLRTSLERQGLTVERLQVMQTTTPSAQSHTHNSTQHHAQHQSGGEQHNTGDRAQQDAGDGRSRGFTDRDHDRDQPPSDQRQQQGRSDEGRRRPTTFTHALHDRAADGPQ